MKAQSGKGGTRTRREDGGREHKWDFEAFLTFLKGVGWGLGLGHKLIDLFLNQEGAIKIFLARSVGK